MKGKSIEYTNWILHLILSNYVTWKRNPNGYSNKIVQTAKQLYHDWKKYYFTYCR